MVADSLAPPAEDNLQQEPITLTADEIELGLASEQFTLYYQPKVCLKTNQVNSAEALIRWHHPEHGLLLPNQFIPFIEQAQLMTELSRWTFNTCFAQFAQWHRPQLNLSLSINVAEAPLAQGHLLNHLTKLAQQYQVPPQKITLEITESIATATTYQTTFTALRKAGYKLSIDDFGIHPIVLSELYSSPFSELKIDRSIVSRAGIDQEADALTKGIISLGHALGYIVAAAGLESAEGWYFLTGLGCDYGQGFYISHPVSAEEFNKWLVRG